MKNKYRGWCHICDKTVKPGDGDVCKVQGHWRTTHTSCVDLNKDLELRATIARKNDETIVNEVPMESYDTSQMNLRLERGRLGH